MLYKTANPHGGDVYTKEIKIDFTTNLNPLGAPLSVTEAAKASISSIGRYPDPYCRKLIDAIAEYEGVEKDFILAGNGAAELIYSYVYALRPKKAVLTAPSFSEYERALDAAGCEKDRYLLREESGFEIGPDFAAYLERSDADLVFICDPNSPTGRLIRPGVLEAIADICRKRKIRLFADECFLDLTGSEDRLKRHLNDMPGLFILKAFTKSYAMPGLRLGYCLCSDQDLLSAMSKTGQSWNVSIPAQAAGIAAAGEKDYLKKSIDVIKEERERLIVALAACGFKVCHSDANYILFRGQAGLDELVLKDGIAIKDCSSYPGLSKGWYRTAVKLPEENDVLITALKKAANAVSFAGSNGGR